MIQPYSLREFAVMLGNAVRSNPQLQRAWVVAELSDVRYSGGHCYMELVEKNQAGQTQAKMRANIWASTARILNNKFFAATGRNIEAGMKVLLMGQATHHQIYGLSFNVLDIDPTYTLGDIERLRKEILQQLTKEGVVDKNKKQNLTEAPQRIAVISAAGAAGYGDFCRQLDDNPDGIKFYSKLFPAIMQGENAAASVMSALDTIEMTIDLWDCVVIIRGGGATTDLICFDNLALARRVAEFPLPIVVGIGHERDNTVLDSIAHTRCKTPTAVAAFLIDRGRESLLRTGRMVDWIIGYVKERLNGESVRLNNAQTLISTTAQQRLVQHRALLSTIAGRIPMLVSGKVSKAQSKIDTLFEQLKSIPFLKIAAAQKDLQILESTLQPTVSQKVSIEKKKLEHLEALIKVLSPENTLRRGYSITRVKGKSVKSADDIKEGDTLQTVLLNGVVTSVVHKLERE